MYLHIAKESVTESELEKTISSLEQLFLVYDQRTPSALNSVNFNRMNLGMPALEGLSLSQEGVIDSIKGGLKKLGSMVSTYAKDTMDRIENLITFTSFQRDRIKKTRESLSSQSGSKKKTVEIRASKYIFYDDKKMASNIETYMAQFRKTAKTLREVNTQNQKHIRHIIIVNTDASKTPKEVYEDFFFNLRDMTDVAVKNIEVETSEKDNDKTFLVSKNMLGMSNIEVKYPNKNTYRIDDIDSMAKVHKHFWITMNRTEKFELEKFKDKIEYNMSQAQALEILDLCDELIESYAFMMSLKAKFAKFATDTVVDINLAIPTVLIFAFFKWFRLMVRTSYTTRNYLDNCFVYSKSLTDHAIKISEDFARKN